MYNSKEIYHVHFDMTLITHDKLRIDLMPNEKIVCARGMNSNDPLLVYATDQGYLYICRINIDGGYICQREDLGTFETLDPEGNVITCRKRPSAICCNEFNILIGYELL